jgi:hypothetical protein
VRSPRPQGRTELSPQAQYAGGAPTLIVFFSLIANGLLKKRRHVMPVTAGSPGL